MSTSNLEKESLEALTLSYENLDNDFKEIQRILDCNKPLPMLNTSSLTNYKDMYTIETAELVKDVYAKDVIRYGYKF